MQRIKRRSAFREFLTGYLDCALFVSYDCTDEKSTDTLDPLDALYSRDDFTFGALLSCARDCRNFLNEENTRDLIGDTSLERAGHDFYLSRNGHGAGFFDGPYGAHCNELQRRAKVYGETNFYVADSGYIEVM